jgi:transcriptional regulator with XRE-family HTH domain
MYDDTNPLPDDAPWHLLLPNERLVLERLRSGETKAAIARSLGVSQQWIAQIERRAWQVLRRSHPYAIRAEQYARDPSLLGKNRYQ